MKKLLLILLFVSGMCYAADPQIVTPTPYEVCGSNGVGAFDLSTKDLEIMGAENPNEHIVTYHETLANAVANTSAVGPMYSNINTSPMTLYARLTNVNTGEFATTELLLIVNSFPTIIEPSDLVDYQTPYTGIATFDLTSQDAVIMGGAPSYSVIYHMTEADASSGTNAISNPSSFVNISNPQTIWVRVEDNTTGCYTITNFDLIIASDDIVYIPDANFKAELVAASPTYHVVSNVNPNSSTTPGVYTTIDINGDGEIQISEALSIVFMNVNNAAIASMQGIEAFENLEQLYCAYNNLTTIDVNGLSNLSYLGCYNNSITSINTTGCVNLQSLICNDNQLTSVDVAALSNLTTLNIKTNQITALDINNLQNIRTVYANFNNLTTLSVSDKNFLTTLEVGYNQLTSVDFNNLPHLYKINVQNNQLTSLDLSTCATMPYFNNIPNASVYDVRCNNNLNLTHINLKNGFANNEIDIISSNLTNQIQYICVDEDDTITDSFYNTNSLVSTYCNFTPGGNYNTITGNLTFDANNDGCDAADGTHPFIKVTIDDGTETGFSFVNNSGDYNFYTQSGTFTVAPSLENPAFFTLTPQNATLNFPIVDNSTQTQNFCLTANGVHPDIEIVIAPVVPARPGFDAVYKIVYKNIGNQVLSQSYGISFFFNHNLMTFVNATPAVETQNLGAINWSYTNLYPFESRSILVTMNVNAPTATNPVNINDVLTLTANVIPATGETNTGDNLFQLNQVVVGSYDPNDITCLQGDIVSPDEIGEYLHYLIRFENTGTDYAENIVVRNIIDETEFDVSSMQLLNASHPVEVRVQGNIAEFIFPSIYLDSGGHGNILLKIRSKNSLTAGTTVSKSASIYFDYNYPVDTNYANTLFQALGIDNPVLESTIKVYPNPSNGIVKVNSAAIIESINVFDVQGRILITRLMNENEIEIDLTSYSSGIYYLKINTDKGSKTEKLIKK